MSSSGNHQIPQWADLRPSASSARIFNSLADAFYATINSKLASQDHNPRDQLKTLTEYAKSIVSPAFVPYDGEPREMLYSVVREACTHIINGTQATFPFPQKRHLIAHFDKANERENEFSKAIRARTEAWEKSNASLITSERAMTGANYEAISGTEEEDLKNLLGAQAAQVEKALTAWLGRPLVSSDKVHATETLRETLQEEKTLMDNLAAEIDHFQKMFTCIQGVADFPAFRTGSWKTATPGGAAGSEETGEEGRKVSPTSSGSLTPTRKKGSPTSSGSSTSTIKLRAQVESSEEGDVEISSG